MSIRKLDKPGAVKPTYENALPSLYPFWIFLMEHPYVKFDSPDTKEGLYMMMMNMSNDMGSY